MSPTPFRGDIPADRLYHAEFDMWVLPDDDSDTLLIGATAFGMHRLGKITGFTGKPRGAKIETGRDMATLACTQTVLAVCAPIGFELIEDNQQLAASPELLNRDPYGAGWMVRVRPLDWRLELGRLIDGKHYRRHVRRIDPDAEFL